MLLLYRNLDKCARNSHDNSMLTDEIVNLLIPMQSQLLSTNSDMVMVFTEAMLQQMLIEASDVVGRSVVYDAATFKRLDLKGFTLEDFQKNDELLSSGVSIEDILLPAILPLRLPGQSADRIREIFKGCKSRHKVIDVLSNGCRRFMQEEFVPNGAREVKTGGSYRKMSPICNDAFVALCRADPPKAIVFSKDALIQSGQLHKLHVNTTEWAPKPGKEKGRVCLNASKSSKNHKSFNESIDYDKHDSMYPPMVRPMIEDIAELA